MSSVKGEGGILIFSIYEEIRALPGAIKSTICLTIILALLAIIINWRLKKLNPVGKTPKWLVPLLALTKLINNFVKTNIGKRWKSYAPFFFFLAIYLLVSNTASIWGITQPTSYIMVNATLAIVIFFIIQVTGIVSNGFKGYLKGFISPIPILLPINIIGELSFPLALCLRITGNMMAGNVISALVMNSFGFAGIAIMPIVNGILDIFSGIIQAVVFIILSIIFVSQKINDDEKIYT